MELKINSQILVNGKTAIVVEARKDRGFTYYKAFRASPKPAKLFGMLVVGQWTDKFVDFYQNSKGEFFTTDKKLKSEGKEWVAGSHHVVIELNSGEGVDLEAWKDGFHDVYSAS